MQNTNYFDYHNFSVTTVDSPPPAKPGKLIKKKDNSSGYFIHYIWKSHIIDSLSANVDTTGRDSLDTGVNRYTLMSSFQKIHFLHLLIMLQTTVEY